MTSTLQWCFARILRQSSTATAQEHTLSGFRSVEVLDIASTMPARSSVAKASHDTLLNRLATKTGVRCGLAAVFCTAAFFSANALWIPVKAQLAQTLIERAWQRSLDGEQGARPWPWADTRPVAVLEVPRLGARQFVLAGASGRNLAFGPTALTPVDAADVVLSGHRDTHFEFLRDIAPGDLLRLELSGATREFRIRFLDVVDSTGLELVLDDSAQRLTLVTCFPFDALAPGGSQRYVVTALPVK